MSENPVCEVTQRAQALLRDITDRVRELRDLDYFKVLRDDMLGLARDTETVSGALLAAQIAQTDEIDQQGMAAALSCPSTASLLRQVLRIPSHEARLRVRAARAVTAQDLPSGGETPPQLPMLAAALDAGLLYRSHVKTILGTMNSLRPSLDAAVRATAEQQLVGYAIDLDADQFQKAAAHLAEVLDPDGSLDQRDPASKVEFTIGPRSASTGLTSINGKLDDLAVETLRAAIDGLAAPKPAAEGIKDPRPAATRRAHALIEVIRRAVTHTDLPGHGGRRPQITVTMNWDLIKHQIGTAVTDGGITLTPATARQLLCDASIIPAILGSNSEVLDLGRSSRTFNQAIRRAITVRDKGCCFPGCDRPAAWTDVHHLQFWERDLGPTSLQNGCLLCPYHHSEIHKEQWRARMSENGYPEFIPPRWIDPGQRARKNTVHHLSPDLK